MLPVHSESQKSWFSGTVITIIVAAMILTVTVTPNRPKWCHRVIHSAQADVTGHCGGSGIQVHSWFYVRLGACQFPTSSKLTESHHDPGVVHPGRDWQSTCSGSSDHDHRLLRVRAGPTAIWLHSSYQELQCNKIYIVVQFLLQFLCRVFGLF